MTIKKKIEVLEKLKDNALAMAYIYEKDEDNSRYEKYFSEFMAIDRCITMLKDNNYCKELAKIFEVEV